jgi:hypothetical protein
MLAHSHSWKGADSAPIENIEKSLWEADSQFVTHPIQCIDFICVADLAIWTLSKVTYTSPKLPFFSEAFAAIYGKDGSASSIYMCQGIGQEKQEAFFSPIGALLSELYSRLAWTFPDMRTLEEYFRKVHLQGSGVGKSRLWPLSIYSEKIRERVYNGALSNGVLYDEWHVHF